MKAVNSAPQRGWLVVALFLGIVAIGSCSDNVAPVQRPVSEPAHHDAGVGNAQTLTWTLSPDPVFGDTNVIVPAPCPRNPTAPGVCSPAGR
jgi:hypothetical protein